MKPQRQRDSANEHFAERETNKAKIQWVKIVQIL